MEIRRFEYDRKLEYFVRRTYELDSLYMKIQAVSGYTVEQLIDMFVAGFTMKPQQ